MDMANIMDNLNGYLMAGGVSLATITPIVIGIWTKIKNATNKQVSTMKEDFNAEKLIAKQKEQMHLKLRVSALKREKQLKQMSLNNPYIDDEKREILSSQLYEIDAEILVIESQLLPDESFIIDENETMLKFLNVTDKIKYH